MDDKTFDKGWKTLIATYRLRPDDERFSEYCRLLKKRFTNAHWLALCDGLAMRPQETEESRFLPAPGDLAVLGLSYQPEGSPAARRSSAFMSCGKCWDGFVPFIRVRFTLAQPGPGDALDRQTYDVPTDAQRSLDWFKGLRATPAAFDLFLFAVNCDCRKDFLDHAAARVNADPRKSGPEQVRPRIYSEIIGYSPPERNNQDAEGLRRDLAIMLSETWPAAQGALKPDRLAEVREVRTKYRGLLAYDVPMWALHLSARKAAPKTPAVDYQKRAAGDVEVTDAG